MFEPYSEILAKSPYKRGDAVRFADSRSSSSNSRATSNREVIDQVYAHPITPLSEKNKETTQYIYDIQCDDGTTTMAVGLEFIYGRVDRIT